jgi:transcriptional regulator with XRE-family HTH domain
MKLSELEPLAAALRACRKKHDVTQEQMGVALGLSRKTYHLLESPGWLPGFREHAHFVKTLHHLDPAAARAFAGVFGKRVEDYALVLPGAGDARGAPVDPRQAKLVFDAAVYATAEELDMSPKALRPIAAMLLARLADGGVTMAQASALAKGAEAGKKKGA